MSLDCIRKWARYRDVILWPIFIYKFDLEMEWIASWCREKLFIFVLAILDTRSIDKWVISLKGKPYTLFSFLKCRHVPCVKSYTLWKLLFVKPPRRARQKFHNFLFLKCETIQFRREFYVSQIFETINFTIQGQHSILFY